MILVLAIRLSAQEPSSDKASYEILQSGDDKIITGDITAGLLWSLFPDWQEEYRNYEPDTDAVETMKSIPDSFQIICVLGSWCSDSRAGVPPFLKALDLAGNNMLQLHLIAVNRDKKVNSVYYPDLVVEAVPTFIIYHGKKEIGRLVEFPQETFESDFVDLIQNNR